MVKPVEYRIDGGPLTPERVREVVEHELVDHELLLRARVGERSHGEPVPADDEARVLVRPPDVPGAGIGAPAARPVLKADEVLVLVEPLRDPAHAMGEEPAGRVLARRKHRRGGAIPGSILEVADDADLYNAGPPRSYCPARSRRVPERS